MNYKRRSLISASVVFGYFLIIAYKTNVAFCSTLSSRKNPTGASFFDCFFRALTDLVGLFRIPSAFEPRMFFPVLLIGAIVSFITYLWVYFHFKEKVENREGHEHGSSHFMTNEELAEYQNRHMDVPVKRRK